MLVMYCITSAKVTQYTHRLCHSNPVVQWQN